MDVKANVDRRMMTGGMLECLRFAIDCVIISALLVLRCLSSNVSIWWESLIVMKYNKK